MNSDKKADSKGISSLTAPMSEAGSDSRAEAGPFAKLLAHIAAQASEKLDSQRLAEPPEIEYFQKTWERLNTGLRLRQAEQRVPENAGPLNSTHLIHRTLLLMQDLSPEYLRRFLSYIDGLSWAEQLNATAASPAGNKASTGTSHAKKSSRPLR